MKPSDQEPKRRVEKNGPDTTHPRFQKTVDAEISSQTARVEAFVEQRQKYDTFQLQRQLQQQVAVPPCTKMSIRSTSSQVVASHATFRKSILQLESQIHDKHHRDRDIHDSMDVDLEHPPSINVVKRPASFRKSKSGRSNDGRDQAMDAQVAHVGAYSVVVVTGDGTIHDEGRVENTTGNASASFSITSSSSHHHPQQQQQHQDEQENVLDLLPDENNPSGPSNEFHSTSQSVSPTAGATIINQQSMRSLAESVQQTVSSPQLYGYSTTNNNGSPSSTRRPASTYLVALLMCLLIIGVIVAVVFLAVVVRGHERQVQEHERLLPKQVLNALPKDTRRAIVTNHASPQARAMQWLAHDPNYDSFDQYQKIQRFALATIVYATTPVEEGVVHDFWYGMEECDIVPCGRQVEDVWTVTELPFLGLSSSSLTMVVMPAEIQLLSALQVLDWSDHSFQTPVENVIIPELALLPNLHTIRFPNCDLSGTLPGSTLGKLSALQRLDVSHNDLYDQIPTQLVALPSLEQLNVAHNLLVVDAAISPAMINVVSSAAALNNTLTTVELILDNNDQTIVFPTDETLMKQLLDLHHEGSLHFAGSLPSEMGLWTALTSFLLVKNDHMSGNLPSEIGGMTALTDLTIRMSGLTGTIPSSLGLLTALADLAMEDNALTGRIPSQLASLTQLETLMLRGNEGLEQDIPDSVCSIESLVYMGVRTSWCGQGLFCCP